MYAVIRTGGKQYRVAQGDELTVERLNGNVGDRVMFDEVLLASDGENTQIGQPLVEDAKVVGRITRQGREKKVLVVKYKRRKGIRRKKGHRQMFTQVKIEEITG
jgi:large subunit ribosomal protein L21